MHEIIAALEANSLVLDLGSGPGSFPDDPAAYRAIRFDLKLPPNPPPNFVQGDASRLPFPSACFDAVLCNHSLEHMPRYKNALQEIGRVVKRSGAVYIAVPDASTPQDRLYRWLTEGKDHVNLFVHRRELSKTIEWYTNLSCAGIRTLHTSFNFLNRRNVKNPAPPRFRLFALRAEWPLALLNKAFRLLDRRFRTRFSHYGWAFYFGNLPEAISTATWNNVCLRCGQAHEDAFLMAAGNLHKNWLLGQAYRCPACTAVNAYWKDESL